MANRKPDAAQMPVPGDDCIVSGLSSLLSAMYGFRRLRRHVLRIVLRLEKQPVFSGTLRRLLRKYHQIELGAYSYAGLADLLRLPPKTKIGRYVSIGPEVLVLRGNHPMDRISTHPFFYHSMFGFVENDTISRPGLTIEADAWIGARSIILQGCSRIGIGAVVGAGSVVTHDVEDFQVVVGAPARPIRRRFVPEVCERLRESRWWELPVEALTARISEMNQTVSTNTSLQWIAKR